MPQDGVSAGGSPTATRVLPMAIYDTAIDDRGRILIPEEVLKLTHLKRGSHVLVELRREDNKLHISLIPATLVRPEEAKQRTKST